MFNSCSFKTAICVSLLALGVVSRINAGVAADTLVVTPEGLKQIGVLKIGDKIICLAKDLSPENRNIEAIQEAEVASVVDVMTEDGVVIRVSPNQRFFVADKWVQADQLAVGDALLKQDRTLIKVKDIRSHQGSVVMRFIIVEKHHNFLVTENGILVHNGFFGASLGCFIGKAAVYVAGHGTIAVVSLAAGAVSGGTLTAPTVWALEGIFGAAIEATSNAAAIACGITGAVATGPI